MKSKTVVFLCLIIVGAYGLQGETAVAQQGYPQPVDKYVNDYAEALEPGVEGDLRAMLVDLEKESGIEATVLTIASIHDYETGDPTIESFATHLFNAWGIGDREKNDGLLVLVAVSDRQVRIELGSGYGKKYDRAMQQVIDAEILPRFWAGDYGPGIYEGTRAAINALKEEAERSSGGSKHTPGEAWLGFLGGLLGGGVLLWLAYKASRRRSSKKRRRSGGSSSFDHWYDDGGSFGGDSFGGGSSDGGGASGEW